MKKTLKVLCLIVIIFFCSFATNRSVQAEWKKCEYSKEEGLNNDDDGVMIKVDPANKGWFVADNGGSGSNNILDHPLDGYFGSETKKDGKTTKIDKNYFWDMIVNKKTCPNHIYTFDVYLEKTCKNAGGDGSGHDVGIKDCSESLRAYVFDQDALNSFTKKGLIAENFTGYNNSGSKLSGKLTFDTKLNRESWVYNKEKSDYKKSEEISFSCQFYKKIWSDGGIFQGLNIDKKDTIKQISTDYGKKCSKNKKTKDCNDLYGKYTKQMNIVNQWCKAVLSISDSNSGCLNKCLRLSKERSKLKIENMNTKPDGKCGVSARIISLVYNFLKWMKYIAPVLVIILSMLDFIKALAAQDDDAMKKAQQKFTKRLISAVLLFLLPLIIDYVLRIFNLYDAGCDITDIFK